MGKTNVNACLVQFLSQKVSCWPELKNSILNDSSSVPDERHSCKTLETTRRTEIAAIITLLGSNPVSNTRFWPQYRWIMLDRGDFWRYKVGTIIL